jgi:hypothetical protein
LIETGRGRGSMDKTSVSLYLYTKIPSVHRGIISQIKFLQRGACFEKESKSRKKISAEKSEKLTSPLTPKIISPMILKSS